MWFFSRLVSQQWTKQLSGRSPFTSHRPLQSPADLYFIFAQFLKGNANGPVGSTQLKRKFQNVHLRIFEGVC